MRNAWIITFRFRSVIVW
uniref:Uncharacterized protein n=1 Tax=Arundo donax TaxID=35708 RepID=A0A0A9AKU4_ARUDO